MKNYTQSESRSVDVVRYMLDAGAKYDPMIEELLKCSSYCKANQKDIYVLRDVLNSAKNR